MRGVRLVAYLQFVFLACSTQVLFLINLFTSTSDGILRGSHTPLFPGQSSKENVLKTNTLVNTPSKVTDYTLSIHATWNDLREGHSTTFSRACPRKNYVMKDDVTMAVHAGTSKLDRLLFSIQRWGGPVSATVYITSTQDMEQLIQLCKEHSNLLAFTDVHLHMEKPYTESPSKPQYPHNILRQAALSLTDTDFFLTLDVDFVTAPNAAQALTDLLKSDPQLVNHLELQHFMVLPAFDSFVEIDDSQLLTSPDDVSRALPSNKSEIQDFLDLDIIYPFHLEEFPLGHGATNFDKWLLNNDGISNFYLIDYALKYEPYVLGYKDMSTLPKYWRNFRGHGFNKWTWLADAYFSEYNFGVLTCPQCFVTHMPHSYHDKAIADIEEYRRWIAHLPNKYDWTMDEAYTIVSDRKEIVKTNVPGPDGVPRIADWVLYEGRVMGRVFNSTLFRDREWIGTAPIVAGEIENGKIVLSASGQSYYLSPIQLEWNDE